MCHLLKLVCLLLTVKLVVPVGTGMKYDAVNATGLVSLAADAGLG